MRARKGRGGQTLFLILSLLVALSMICGTVLVIWPSAERRVRPTLPPVQATPTHMWLTLVPSTPTITPTPTLAIAPSPLPQPTP